jgi:hypothetical protein
MLLFCAFWYERELLKQLTLPSQYTFFLVDELKVHSLYAFLMDNAA